MMGKSVDDRKATHDDRRNHHGHADGQIDSRGQDDKGLSDGQYANDRHLGQHGRKIGGGDEVGEIDGGAEQHAEHQHDERDDRRVRMEEALDALNGRKRLLLERGLCRRCASALEFLRRGPPLRGLAHGALAPVFHVARIEQVFEGCVGFGGVGIVVSGLHLRGDELALNFAGRGVAQFKQPIDASFRLAVGIEQETHVMRALADKGFALASCNLLARDRLRHR